MLKELKMPRLSLGDEEVTVVKWCKERGDRVIEGETVLEVDTDKATMEVEAPFAGVIEEIIAAVGDIVRGGEVLARVAIQDAATSGVQMEFSGSENAGTNDDKHHGRPISGAIAGLPQSLSAPAPARQRLQDQAYSTNSAGSFMKKSPSKHRVAIARAMTASSAIPQFSMMSVIETHPVQRTAKGVSFSDIFVAALARAAVKYPEANAWMVDDELLLFDDVNVAYAVDTNSGVVAPVVRRANVLSLEEIASSRRDLVRQATESKLRNDDLLGATISLSNIGGGFAVDQMTPLLTPPQVVAIGTGRSRVTGSLQSLAVTLVADHRALDGGDGARFLQGVSEALMELMSLTATNPTA